MPAEDVARRTDHRALTTVAGLWQEVSGRTVGDDLLEWAPDVFALTDLVLERSEAYRFAVAPPPGQRWPPARLPGWNDLVTEAAQRWCAAAERRPRAPLPDLVSEEWTVLRDGAATPLDEVGDGRAWRLCEALLTLHAVADEACAGMGGALEGAGDRGRTAEGGHCYRGRARELLARTGSLARVQPDRLRVLPKVRTPSGGISFRSLSRYACVRSGSVDAVWNKAPMRRSGAAHQQANVLLLPWPLRVRSNDFRPLRHSLQRTEREPFGLFEFAPTEALDLDLADRVLAAALDEVETVDVVVLPESALRVEDLDGLEALLVRRGVTALVAGVREPVQDPERLPGNWVRLAVFLGGRWWHYRQNKHHRWFLDRGQVDQYHLGAALHPRVRWWEAIDVPRRAVNFLELGEGITFVSLVCEDLARLDEVADLLRAVGPTLVVTILLDGPQLASRWTARYAAVLADDPGSSVLTLSCYGMVRRARPMGRAPSSVVALWKSQTDGLREIALEDGAQGVVLTVCADRARRRSADGRWPVDNTADLVVAAVHQVRAGPGVPPAAERQPSRWVAPPTLDNVELTVLASWADALADAVAMSPDGIPAVLADVKPDASWRGELGIEEPSGPLTAALETLVRLVGVAAANGAVTPDGLLAALHAERSDHDANARLVRIVAGAALESHGARLGSAGAQA